LQKDDPAVLASDNCIPGFNSCSLKYAFNTASKLYIQGKSKINLSDAGHIGTTMFIFNRPHVNRKNIMSHNIVEILNSLNSTFFQTLEFPPLSVQCKK
jgi:hypothetical protein